MPRNGSGTLTAPPGIRAAANETIRSAQFNAFLDDWVSDGNAARPISAGGTGALSKEGAQAALDVVPQADTADTTTDRLLKVGAGGWLATDGIAVPGDDCNLITRSGIYRGTTGVTLNMPVANDCAIFHIARTTARARQLAFGATDMLYVRRLEGTWGTWSAVDYIIDSGSNANGTYVKYASGKIECRASITFDAPITVAFMGGFRCPPRTWDFPVSFNDGLGVPSVFCAVSGGTAFGAERLTGTTETQAFFMVTAVTAQAADSRSVSLYAVRF